MCFQKKFAKYVYSLTLFLFFLGLVALSCAGKSDSEKSVLGKSLFRSEGRIARVTGRVVDKKNKALADVQVFVNAKGKTFRAKTDLQGLYSLKLEEILRGEGYNIHYSLKGYRKRTLAAVFSLDNLRVEMKNALLVKKK